MPKATAPVFDALPARPRTHAREKSRFARPRVELHDDLVQLLSPV